MMLIDTHTHLYLEEFGDLESQKATVSRAVEAGVGQMIFPNVDLSTIAPMQNLAAAFPDKVAMAMGLHPTAVGENWKDDTAEALSHLDDGNDYVAIGEVGIDLYWDKSREKEQMKSFDMQVEESVKRQLPLIIHCREGLPQTLEVLSGYRDVKAVFHSFGGTIADVEAIRRVGDFYFGINGIVTFKNCKVRDVLPAISLERLLLETDAPYLAPVPHRGHRNESAYLLHTAGHIAAHSGLTLDQVASATSANAKTLFQAL